jgi:signal transduction histidine kinase
MDDNLQNLKHDEITVQPDGIFESIENFISFRNLNSRSSKIFRMGLEVFQNIPGSISSNLFLLNDNSFEFDQKISIPETYQRTAYDYMDIMIEDGLIGKALNSSKIVYQGKDINKNYSYNCLVIPLIGTSGIMGIVLVFNKLPINEINTEILEIYNVFASLFATSIENILLNKHLYYTNEIIEQELAIRTMDLAKNNKELDSIFNSVYTGILVIDSNSDKIIKVNPVASALIGDYEQNILGSTYQKYLDPLGVKIDITENNISFSKNYESILKKANGENLPILRTNSTIDLGSNQCRIESFMDISERKKAEIALKDTNEILELRVQERTLDLQVLVHKLKEQVAEREQAESEVRKMLKKEKDLNELKTRFVSLVSHEFRTPLTIIRTSAQLVDKFSEKLSKTEKRDYLDRIMKTVDYMEDLIENVVFIGKTNSEKFKLKPTKIKIKDYCEQLINDIMLSLDKKRVIELIPEGTNNLLFTDGKILRQILTNLISNAIKYSDEKYPIYLTLLCDEDKSYFSVKDKGIGIPENDQKYIFDLFYRGTNVGNIPGNGLGMSVIIASLKMLKGKIEFSSKMGEGTTFKVSIPNISII